MKPSNKLDSVIESHRISYGKTPIVIIFSKAFYNHLFYEVKNHTNMKKPKPEDTIRFQGIECLVSEDFKGEFKLI